MKWNVWFIIYNKKDKTSNWIKPYKNKEYLIIQYNDNMIFNTNNKLLNLIIKKSKINNWIIIYSK